MSKKLFVGSLPFSTTQDEMRDLFTEFGTITEATLITDRATGRSKGFGFVTFENDEEADKALQEMQGKEVGGRTIVVNEARPMEERPRRREGGNFNRY